MATLHRSTFFFANFFAKRRCPRGVGHEGTPYNFDRRQNSYSTDIGHALARAQMQNEPPMQILNVVYAATISYTMYAR